VVVLIPPRTLPKTSSGKVRRRETRAAFEAGRLPMVDVSRDGNRPSATTDLGGWIVDRIAELRDVPPSAIGRNEVFLELGIDSAEAAELVAALEERVGRQIPMRIFLEHPTIDALARALAESPA
jgi:acyl carrier protein